MSASETCGVNQAASTTDFQCGSQPTPALYQPVGIFIALRRLDWNKCLIPWCLTPHEIFSTLTTSFTSYYSPHYLLLIFLLLFSSLLLSLLHTLLHSTHVAPILCTCTSLTHVLTISHINLFFTQRKQYSMEQIIYLFNQLII